MQSAHARALLPALPWQIYEPQHSDGSCVQRWLCTGRWCLYRGFFTSFRVFLGRYSPRCRALCAAEPDEYCGPAVAPLMSSTPVPFAAIPAAFVDHRPEKVWPCSWSSGLWHEPWPLGANECLCLASVELGKGWTASDSPQLSALNVHGLSRDTNLFCSGQSAGTAAPIWGMAAGYIQDFSFETDSSMDMGYPCNAC